MCNGNFCEKFKAEKETGYNYSMQSHAKPKYKEHWLFFSFFGGGKWYQKAMHNYEKERNKVLNARTDI